MELKHEKPGPIQERSREEADNLRIKEENPGISKLISRLGLPAAGRPGGGCFASFGGV